MNVSIHSPIRLLDVVFNYLNTVTTLPLAFTVTFPLQDVVNGLHSFLIGKTCLTVYEAGTAQSVQGPAPVFT
jgi:hypothetical protein